MKIKFLIFVILFFVSILHSQDAQSILNKIQNKFEQVKDFEADFSQSTGSSSFDNAMNMSGKFQYKKENKFRIEMEKQVIVSNGETIWNFDNNLNRVVINNVSDDPSAFSIENYVYGYPAKCDIGLVEGDKSRQTIRLKPKDHTLQFNSVDLTANPEGLIKKISVLDLNDYRMTIELSNISINNNLSDSQFNFLPPEGSKIIDLR